MSRKTFRFILSIPFSSFLWFCVGFLGMCRMNAKCFEHYFLIMSNVTDNPLSRSCATNLKAFILFKLDTEKIFDLNFPFQQRCRYSECLIDDFKWSYKYSELFHHDFVVRELWIHEQVKTINTYISLNLETESPANFRQTYFHFINPFRDDMIDSFI